MKFEKFVDFTLKQENKWGLVCFKSFDELLHAKENLIKRKPEQVVHQRAQCILSETGSQIRLVCLKPSLTTTLLGSLLDYALICKDVDNDLYQRLAQRISQRNLKPYENIYYLE